MSSRVTRAIIGTAGHIDHGKTALIKALTGQDTDRLKEEKERGISIDLGFAYLTLPGGFRAGIVDVPGHERFIRNMLAGAHGIDLVLFAIAADDGVMPQSEEHLDILHLLGARRGIFVITKADLADGARIAEVRDEIRLFCEGTTLAGAPVIAVSSITGSGLENLRAEIIRQLSGFEGRRESGIFRLPLDRAFVIRGHGVVVTGTATGSTVAVGQKLRVLPGGTEMRVRSVQVHGEAVEKAELSQRVALNLTGAENIKLKRGDVLVDERLELTTARFDAIVEIRPSVKRPFKNNERIRIFIGTAEVLGRAIVLDERGAIAPKVRGLVQLVLNETVVALSGDRFIIRDRTNVRTLGGGMVLNPIGRKFRKPLNAYRNNLDTLVSGSDAGAIEALLSLQEVLALTPVHIAQLLNRPVAEVETALKDARFVKLPIGDERGYTTGLKWAEVKTAALAAVMKHHAAEPLSPGIEMEALRARLPYEVGARDYRAVVDRLAQDTEIVREEHKLRLKPHRVNAGESDGELVAQVETRLRSAGFQPPELKQLAQELKFAPNQIGKLRSLLAALEREGKVFKIATDLYFARDAADAARIKLIEHLQKHSDVTAAAYRDILGASRKFAIALLDYFDHTGVTTRVGDSRKLRAKPV